MFLVWSASFWQPDDFAIFVVTTHAIYSITNKQSMTPIHICTFKEDVSIW